MADITKPAELASDGSPAVARRWLGAKSTTVAIGLVLWLIAVAAAFAAQYQLTPLQDLDTGALLYAVAAVLGIAGIALIDRGAPSPAPTVHPSSVEVDAGPTAPAETSGVPWARVAMSVALIAMGIAASGGTAAVLIVGQNRAVGFWLWLASLVLLPAGFALWPRAKHVSPTGAPRAEWGHVERAVLVAILVVTLALRLPSLAEIPAEVHGDEAAIGIEARTILRGDAPGYFGVGWYDVPRLSFGIPALFMWLFGDNLFGLRIASVVQGTLSVLFLYLLARRLFSARVAAIAAFFLAVAQWHIHFSRSGTHYMQSTFATVLVLYFVVRGLQTRRSSDFLIAGLAAGLSVNVYYAARIAPVLAALYVAYHFARDRELRRIGEPWVLAFALGMLVFLTPMLVHYARNPISFMTRSESVLIFNPRNLEHASRHFQTDRVEVVLAQQTLQAIEAFNLRGETSLQYGRRGPLLDFWTGALFVVGIATLTVRLRDHRYFLLGSWFWLTLAIGGILTVDALFSPRVVPLIPVICLAPALVVDAGWRGVAATFGRAGWSAFAIPVGILIAIAAWNNYDEYFNDHVREAQPASFATTLSRFILANNDRYQIYLISRANTSLRYDTTRFLAPDVDGVDVRDAPLPLPLDRIPAAKGIAFVVESGMPDAAARLEAIKLAYPGGREQVHTTTTDRPLFTSYLVEHDRLLAANPDARIDPTHIPALRLTDLRGTTGAAGGSLLAIEGFGEPRGVAVDASGTIHVLDRGRGRVERYNQRGERESIVGEGRLVDPRAIAVASNGEIFVLDVGSNVVHRFTPDGSPLGQIDLPGVYYPAGLSVDDRGTIYVADTGRNRLFRISPDGGEATTIGQTDDPRAQLHEPTDAVLGPNGELYVADTGVQRIVVFGPDLSYRREWEIPPSDTVNGPHLAVTRDRVFVTAPREGRVIAYDLNGQEQTRIGDDRLRRPVGVAVDQAGTLYVAAVDARTVFRFAIEQGESD